MRVAICSIGSELLSGEVVDTNATWLVNRLREIDAPVVAHLVLGDHHQEIVDGLAWLSDRADAVVVGGGLGPTPDDLTRYAVADLAGLALKRRGDLVEHLKSVYARLGQPMPSTNLRQADVPLGAQVHSPPPGTAAAFALDLHRDDRTVRIHVLPGVPWEFQQVAERHVLPDLLRRGGTEARVTRTLHVVGMGESTVAELLEAVSGRLERAAADSEDHEHGVEVSFLAGNDEIRVGVTATGKTPEEARQRTGPLVDEIADRLGAAMVGIDERRLEDEVARLLRARNMTIATAESCSAGGRLAALLGVASGACDYLAGSIVAFGTGAGSDVLGLPRQVVEQHGLFAEETAQAMAVAARRRFGTDIGLALTAVAEQQSRAEAAPAADRNRSVGTVVWAAALPDGTVRAHARFIPGDREIVQARGAAFAIASLREHLLTMRLPLEPG